MVLTKQSWLLVVLVVDEQASPNVTFSIFFQI
jgi:hypothetical protein